MGRGGKCRQVGCSGTYLGNNRCTVTECLVNNLTQKRSNQRDQANQASRAARLLAEVAGSAAAHGGLPPPCERVSLPPPPSRTAAAMPRPEAPLIEINPYALLAHAAGSLAVPGNSGVSIPPPRVVGPGRERSPRRRSTSFEHTWVMIKGIHAVADIMTEMTEKIRNVATELEADMANIDGAEADE